MTHAEDNLSRKAVIILARLGAIEDEIAALRECEDVDRTQFAAAQARS